MAGIDITFSKFHKSVAITTSFILNE